MNPITPLEGRLTADPELRFTPSGQAVCNFTIVTSDRVKNETTNQWEDKATSFWRCSAWGQMAENCAETLTKGMHVLATAKLSQRDYETREGEKRTTFEARIYQIGPCLQYATATVRKAERGSQQSQPAAQSSGPAAPDPFASEPPF